jgi:hypothetical protein
MDRITHTPENRLAIHVDTIMSFVYPVALFVDDAYFYAHVVRILE